MYIHRRERLSERFRYKLPRSNILIRRVKGRSFECPLILYLIQGYKLPAIRLKYKSAVLENTLVVLLCICQ